MTCDLCGEEIEDVDYCYQMVQGWERKRERGGTNAIRLRRLLGGLAHANCVDREARKINAKQQAMFTQ